MKIQSEFHGKKYKKPTARDHNSTATLDITPRKRDSIYDALLHEQSIYVNDFFAHAPLGVAFKNGWVSGKDFSLYPHTPDQRCRVRMDCDFDKSAKCPEFLACINSYFAKDDDGKDKITAIQEFFGACLFGRATSFQRAMLFLGPKAGNGKSTLIEVLSTALFPKRHMSAIPPEQWGIDYYRASLTDSVINLCGEIGKLSFKEFSIFKNMITGGESAARRIKNNPFSFTPMAGHIMEANRLPSSDDDSNGFWRRLLIITFNNTIENAIPTDKFVRHMMAEQRGIINWAISGAIRLFERGHYIIPNSHDLAIERWKQDTNNVLDFFVTHYEKSSVTMTNGAMMYDAYKRYCCASGEAIARKRAFDSTLEAYGVKKRIKRCGNSYFLCHTRKTPKEMP